MKISHFKWWRRVSALGCVAVLATVPVLADEQKSTSETKARSTTAQAELRGKDEASGQPSSQTLTGGSETTEKTEKESKDAQLKEGSERKVFNNRVEVRLPFDRMSQEFPAAMVQAFSSSNAMGPSQRKKLRQAISEALEQNNVASEIIDETLSRVDKALDEIGAQSNFSWRGSGKLPFRVGIGCKLKEANDKTQGLEVETVFEDSPAAKAGLKPGDRLTTIDEQPIYSHDDIVSAVQKAGEEGHSVRLEAIRDGVSTVYELKPHQSAVAELHTEFFQPGGASGFSFFPGPAWIMPQRPKDNSPHSSDSKLHNQNEKHSDELRNELSGVRKELEEIKDALRKLSEKR